ncbi:hypothetical protein P8935_22730 [Telmatobacter sp. DSM 110680]|uniref:Uncharacterized protein n=1 Tax=Telmatobacter sp. DSM 110680 TaxID=3036704 RepID=A0AAU7DJV9_9BACT
MISKSHRWRPALFTDFFMDLLAALLVAVFLPAAGFESFLAGDFLAGTFLAAFFALAFFAAGFAVLAVGSFLSISETAAIAPPTAVLTAPATSDAIAIPTPTVSPALSTIVFFAILTPSDLCSCAVTDCRGISE